MAIARVQFKPTYFNADSTTLAFDSAVTAGNLIVVTLHGYEANEATTTVVDNLSNSYTKRFWTTGGDGALYLSLWYAWNIAGGSCTLTINPGGSSTYCSVCAVEYSGVLNTATPIDGSNSATGTGTAVNSGAITPTQTGDLLIACMTSMAGGQVSITGDGDYTQIAEYENGSTHMHMHAQERFYNSVSADTANWTIGSSLGWIGGIAAFKAAPVTTASLPPLNAARRNRHMLVR